MPLVKWVLAIPHYVVLLVLTVASIFAVVVAWFAVVITGRYPRPLFSFIVGFLRWNYRVTRLRIPAGDGRSTRRSGSVPDPR